MNVLSFDTSSDELSIAVLKNGQVLTEYSSALFTKNSSLLLPCIEKALKQCSLSMKQINVVVVGLGPGSFTGLRMGVTAAKILGFSSGKKLIGISSLDAIAYSYIKSSGSEKVALALDAKKNSVYAAAYEFKKGSLKAVIKPVLTTQSDFTKKIGNKYTLMTKEDVAAHSPKAKDLADLAKVRSAKNKWDDPFKLVPLYLHARDCNVMRAAIGEPRLRRAAS